MIKFDERCLQDPEGVIKDLLSQQRRQAKTIREQRVTIEQQCEIIKKLESNIEKLEKKDKE